MAKKAAVHPIEKDLRRVLGDRVPEHGDDEQEFLQSVVKLIGGSKVTDDEYNALSEATRKWAEVAVPHYKDHKEGLAFEAKPKKAVKPKKAKAEDDEGAATASDEAEEPEEAAAAAGETTETETEPEMATATKTAKKSVKAKVKKAAPPKAKPAKEAKAKPVRAKKGNGKANGEANGEAKPSDTSRARALICKHLDSSSEEIQKLAEKDKINVKYLGALYYHVHSTVAALRELGKMK